MWRPSSTGALLGAALSFASIAHAQPAPVPPPPVDLAVTQLSPSSGRARVGDTLRIGVAVTNLGLTDSPEVSLCLDITVDQRLAGTLARPVIPTLSPGAQWAWEFELVVPAGQRMTLTAIADCDSQLLESVETNNLASVALTLEGAPLSLPPQTLPNAQVGVGYRADIVAHGGTPPYEFFAAGAPPGMAVDPSGLVLGVPGRAGEYVLEVRVVDSANDAASAPVRLIVLEGAGVPVIGAIDLPTAVIGRDYCATRTIQLPVSGGLPPYSWRAAFLPSGLTLDREGRLCGVPLGPPVDGRILADVDDAQGASARGEFPISIVAPTPLALGPIVLPDATVGAPYQIQLTARGGEPPYAFTLDGGDALPAGLTLESGGRLHGTPTEVTARTVAVTARDAAGGRATATARLVVGDAPAQLLEEVEPPGCGCHAGGASGGAWVLLALLMLLWRRRRA